MKPETKSWIEFWFGMLGIVTFSFGIAWGMVTLISYIGEILK